MLTHSFQCIVLKERHTRSCSCDGDSLRHYKWVRFSGGDAYSGESVIVMPQYGVGRWA
jgi:hypothetical protein